MWRFCWKFLKSCFCASVFGAVYDEIRTGGDIHELSAFDSFLMVSLYVFIFWFFFRGKNKRRSNFPELVGQDLTLKEEYKSWLENLPNPNVKPDLVGSKIVGAEVLAQQKYKSNDYNATLEKLSNEEKFILLVGLLALYGDGEISLVEIYQLRKILSKVRFKPKDLIHRDPLDLELCLDEKVVWALSLIKANFVNSNEFTSKEIVNIFKQILQSIEDDNKSDARQKKFSDEIKEALALIASADGKISKQEKRLVQVFMKSSKYQ